MTSVSHNKKKESLMRMALTSIGEHGKPVEDFIEYALSFGFDRDLVDQVLWELEQEELGLG